MVGVLEGPDGSKGPDEILHKFKDDQNRFCNSVICEAVNAIP